jgi:hypothetical protein
MSTIYLHEIIYTVPGREDPYMASVTSLHYDPVRMRETGPAGYGPEAYRAFAQFYTAGTSGTFPRVVNMWEMDLGVLAEALKGQFNDKGRDAYMEDWWNRNLNLRRGGYDRILFPTSYTEDGAAISKRGVRREVFLQEIVWLPFGERERYLGELEQRLLPAAGKMGIELIGAYRVSLRPRQVVTIFAASDWSKFAKFVDTADDNGLRPWREYRNKLVLRTGSLIGLPARHEALAVRREAAYAGREF